MPSPLDALKYMFSNPGEAAGMAGDMMMQNYSPMPQQDFGQAGQMPFPNPFFPGANMQDAYDFTRDMTSLHPAAEIAGAAAGLPIVGRAAGKFLGPVVRGMRGAGDEVAQYMGRVKPAGGGGAAALGPDVPLPNPGPMPQASPLGGFGDNAAGSIRADVPPPAPPQMPPVDPNLAGAPPAPPNPYMPEGGMAGAMQMSPPGQPGFNGPPEVQAAIQEAAEGFMSMGATPEEAYEAAMMQFSDLLAGSPVPQ